MSNDVDRKPNNLIRLLRYESNVSMSNMPVHTPREQNADLILEQSSVTDDTPKMVFINSSAKLKGFNEPSKNSQLNINEGLLSSQLMSTSDFSNKDSLWPIGISYQPDFIEIVVTDEEMNAYWDSLDDSF